MPELSNKVIGASMIVAAAGLILNYLTVAQAFLMIAIMSVVSTPRGWPDTNNWADTAAFLITASSAASLLYFGIRFIRNKTEFKGSAAIPILAVPSVLLTTGVALAAMTAMGSAAVPAQQYLLLIGGSATMIVAYLLATKGHMREGAAAGAVGTVLVALVAVPNPLSGFILRLGWGDVLPAALRASLVCRPEVLLSAAIILAALSAGAPERLIKAVSALPALALAHTVYELWGISLKGLVLPSGGEIVVALYVASFLAGPILLLASSAASALALAKASVARGP